MATMIGIQLLLLGTLHFVAVHSGLLSGVPSLLTNVISTVENKIHPTFLNPANPIAYLTSPQIIAYYGYPVETHTVTTKDGYILNMFRIPYGKTSTTNQTNTRGVVFLQHGLLCSSADWLVNTVENNPPLLLADLGYDVWLGNARGTNYSNGHINPAFDSSDIGNEYWDFSFHEMGIYDIPAVLDYIITTTGVPKIFYIGHSMGGTMFYVCMSERPEYNDKIKAMYGLGPVAYTGNMSSPAVVLSVLATEQAMLLDGIGWGQFIPQNLLSVVHSLLPTVCANDPLNLCGNILYILEGYNPSQTNPNVTSAALGHTPATASSRSVYHFLEEVIPNKFRQFDFGLVENLKKYGTQSPPDYDLSRITADINLYAGGGDTLADAKDIQRTHADLVNSRANYTMVSLPRFNHLDFVYATNLYDLVLKDVFTKMSFY